MCHQKSLDAVLVVVIWDGGASRAQAKEGKEWRLLEDFLELVVDLQFN